MLGKSRYSVTNVSFTYPILWQTCGELWADRECWTIRAMAKKRAFIAPSGSVESASKPNGSDSASAVVAAHAAASLSDATPLSERGERIAATIRPDGALDLDSMRPATRERLLKAIKATPLPGAESHDMSKAVEELKPLAMMLYSTMGSVAASIAMASGYTRDQASVLLFTSQEQIGLAEPTARVLLKHSASLAYADEAILATALLGVIMAKVNALKAASMERASVASSQPRPHAVQ